MAKVALPFRNFAKASKTANLSVIRRKYSYMYSTVFPSINRELFLSGFPKVMAALLFTCIYT
jgi:hypothetical protein